MAWIGPSIPELRREAHFGDRVVACFDDRPRSLYALLAEAAARAPDAEALVCGALRMRWRDVLEATARLAGALADRGLAPGDRAALLLGNRIEFVLSLFAITRLGAIAVPLSTRLQTPEIAYALDDCGARVLIHEADLAGRLPGASDTPALTTRLFAGGAGIAPGASEPLADLLAGPISPALPHEPDEDATAVILYTSGTTGRPKGAMLSHGNLVHSAIVFEACMGLTAADRSIVAVPLAHVTGLVANALTMARCGGALLILPAFKAEDFIALAATERMTHTLVVPAIYELCLRHPSFETADLSAWRVGGYGGAPMPVATIERMAERLPGVRLMNAYGATETTSPATMMPHDKTATKGDSVGLPVPGVRVIVVDDAGREVPVGETGELWIDGAPVVKGYWNRPEATADSFTGGFWHSGDIGSVDAEGFVFVHDRKKDMINRGGLKIFSAEVESVLAACPGVLESAIVAKPCPVLGERVHAFVVVQEGIADASRLQAYCADRLSDYKVPESFTLRAEALPRNANGKVMKQHLRQQLPIVPA